MYRITIERVNDAEGTTPDLKLYEQTVEELDIRAVMAGVNKRPRKSRAKSAQNGASEQAKK